MIILGNFVVGCSVSFFILPNNILTGGVAGVSVFASKVFGNFALAATADVFVSTSLSEGIPMILS